MKLSELIATYGDDKVVFQNLDQCAVTLNYSAKNGTEIAFRTAETLALDGTVKLGLVIWMDRERLKEIMARKALED